MTRAASPRLLGFAAIAALGLVASLALRRPELAAVAAPIAVLLALGTAGAREPRIQAELGLATDRVVEREPFAATLTVATSEPVNRLELLLELPDGVVATDGTPARALRLARGEERMLDVELATRRWGVFELGRVGIRARDRLRLVTWEATLRAPVSVKAYPTPLRLRRLLAPLETQAFAGSEVARVKGEGIEYADIRDFVPGDRVRSINWRASARRQGLVVNERHPERNTDVVLFVDSFADVRAEGRSVLEDAVRATAALATRYLERRDRVGLVGFGGVLRWLQPGMGTTQRYRLVETVLETGVEPTYTWRDATSIPSRILPPKALVVALTPLVDPRFVSTIEDLRGRRFDVVVVEVDPAPLVGRGTTATAELARRLWLLEREALRARLVASGVGVATWGGDDLDSVLEEVNAFRRYARPARA